MMGILGFFYFFVPLIYIKGAVGNVMPYFVPKEDVAYARIPEGTPIGTIIYTFLAEDLDGDPLTFDMKEIRPRGHGTFKIETISSTESNLILQKELDRENISEYYFDISITDGRTHKRVTQNFMVIVEDVNDNTPVFKPYNSTLTFMENDAVPKLVSILKAEDADEGPNGEVSYTLVTDTMDRHIFNMTHGNNGEVIIYALEPFDTEIKDKHIIRVIAEDNPLTGKHRSAQAEITITVIEANAKGQMVAKIQNFSRVREDVPVNTEICRPKSIELDFGQKISYELLNENDKFTMEIATGIIRTKIRYNLEPYTIHRNYTLRIRVTESSETKRIKSGRVKRPSKYSYEISTIVEIVDVDDAPHFRYDTFEGSIPENSLRGVPLNLKDGIRGEVFDNDMNGKDIITMKIEGEGGTFEVFPTQGYSPLAFQIVVKDPLRLDYERLQEIIFHLVATDSSGHQRTLLCSAYITDMNDNAPVFMDDTRRVKIKENPECGQHIIQLKATDADSTYYGMRGLHYSILSGYGSKDLQINGESGNISIKDPCNSSSLTAFDRERYSEVNVLVRVCDNRGNSPSNCVSDTVTIELEDENDNAPQFMQPYYEMEIMEGVYDTSIPLRILTFDADQPGTPNSEIRFTVSSSQSESEETMNGITVDPVSKYVHIEETLDFEKLFNVLANFSTLSPTGIMRIVLNFIIQAYDLGVPRQTNSTNFTLSIVDKNDCAPKFSKYYYEVIVAENSANGLNIIKVHATDLDVSPIYNSFTYRYAKDGPGTDIFQLDPNSGAVSVSGKLDYSLNSNYILEIEAVDALGLKSVKNCIVNITILDVNDRPPEFIPEDGKEADEMKKVSCPGNVHYRIELAENTPPDTIILQAAAKDPDANAKLFYAIQFNESRAYKHRKIVNRSDILLNNYLSINHVTGLILAGPMSFDFEVMDEVKAILSVEDTASDTGRQGDYARLTIEIRNVNDGEPHFFHSKYEPTIAENSVKGTTLVQVFAADENGNRDQIRYSIRASKMKNFPFSIDPDSGVISVLHNIDRESMEWINFTVIATDENSKFKLTSAVPVNVRVLDENDNAPIFQDSITNASVKENSPLGTIICQMRAVDADSDSFGAIKYFIDTNSFTREFSIDENSGIITVSANLDREKRDRYTLIVDAVDNYHDPLHRTSHVVSKSITIIIEDVNDEVPVIHISPFLNKLVYNPRSSNTYYIPEEYNQSIITFSVEDDDKPHTNNSAVNVTITADNAGGKRLPLFELVHKTQKETSGSTWSIQPAKPLYGLEGNYSITIQAEDKGIPRNNATKRILIIVRQAIPSFDPKRQTQRYFVQNSISAFISPNFKIGRRLCQVLVLPNLEETNASFYIASKVKLVDGQGENEGISQSNQNIFRIDPLEGMIYLNANITEAMKVTPSYFIFQVSVKHDKNKNFVGDILPVVKIYNIQENQMVTLFSKLVPRECHEILHDLKFVLEEILKLNVVINNYFVMDESTVTPEENKTRSLGVNSVFQLSLFCPDSNKALSKQDINKIFNGNVDQLAEAFQNFEIIYTFENGFRSGVKEVNLKTATQYLYFATYSTLTLMGLMICLFVTLCPTQNENRRPLRQKNPKPQPKPEKQERCIEYDEIIAGTGMTSNLAKTIKVALEPCVDENDEENTPIPTESDC